MSVEKVPESVDELFVWMDPMLTQWNVEPTERASLKTRIERVKVDSDDLSKCLNIICVGDETAERLQQILPNRFADCRVLVCVVPKLTTEEVVQTTIGDDDDLR